MKESQNTYVELDGKEVEFFKKVSREPYRCKWFLNRLDCIKKIVKFFVIKRNEANATSFHLNANDSDIVKEVGSGSKVSYVMKFMFSTGILKYEEEDVIRKLPTREIRYILDVEKYKICKNLYKKVKNINQKVYLGLVRRYIGIVDTNPFNKKITFKKRTDKDFVDRCSIFLKRNDVVVPGKPLENYKTDWEEYNRVEKEKPQPSTEYLLASLMSEIGTEQHNEKSVSEELANDIE